MQAVGRGIEPNVAGSHLGIQLLFCTRHYVLDHSPPFQFFDQLHLAAVSGKSNSGYPNGLKEAIF
jgi:hypothetical protein